MSQVLGERKFSLPLLAEIFGGKQAMLESPLLQKMIAEKMHELILDALKERFDRVPRNVTKLLGEIMNEKKLRQLNRVANTCPDIEAFREALLS